MATLRTCQDREVFEMPEMAVTDWVASNIKSFREEQGLTRQDFARRLNMYHREYKSWNAAKIAGLERTRSNRYRSTTVDDLVACASVLHVELWRFFVPPPNGPTDSFTWQTFGMSPQDLRALADSGKRLWTPTSLPPMNRKVLAERHPLVRRTMHQWIDDEIAAGRTPVHLGWGWHVAEAVERAAQLFDQLLLEELITIPDEMISWDVHPDTWESFVSMADKLWAEAMKEHPDRVDIK